MDEVSKLKNMKVLLIDDDEIIRDSLGIAFKSKGYDLTLAETAEKGLLALEKKIFDVIISDYKLTGIDGLEFFKLASTVHQNSVNILITAHGGNELYLKASKTGVHDVFIKPFSPTKIFDFLTLYSKGENKVDG
jgi:DNA-binding NtrC family response regulator